MKTPQIQSIDTGNYDTKVAANGLPVRVVQSLIAVAPTGTPMSHTFSLTTRTIQYLSGPRADLVGGMWVIGKGAANLRNAKPLAVNDSKAAYALQLVLATMHLPEEGGNFTLRRLALCLPEPAIDGDKLINSVQGIHVFVLNGVTYEVEIPQSAIEVFYEGVGIDSFCRKRGLVETDEFLGVVDVGGGTIIGTLFDSESNLIASSRRIVSPVNQSGVFSGLASSISQHPLFVQKHGRSPDPRLIVEALVKNTYSAQPNPAAPARCLLVPNEPLLYAKTGFDFSDIFTEVNTQWWESAIQEIWGAWSEWRERIGRVAVAGGGAALFRALVDDPRQQGVGFFFTPDDPAYPETYRVCNVVGCLGLISPDFPTSHRTPSDEILDSFAVNGKAPAAVKGGSR